VLVLALPGTALAGGAGDDQYQDPFEDPPAESAPESTTPEPEAAPAPQAAPAQAAPSTQAAAPTLPRTGAEAGITAVAGGVLVLAGMALRRRTADDVPS
jgi:pyruvate dehydrogenase E2 component (dihydrolipoamide acetyltransferase)